MKINLTGIPEELKKCPNWVNWHITISKKGKATKPPLNSKTHGNADTSKPSTWGNYEQAVKTWKECENESIEGIGFVVNGNGYCGIDFDHCRNPETGLIKDWAREYIRILDSYTEISPSEQGIHIFVKGKLPEDGRKKGDIEMYYSRRYLTVTGNHLPGTPTTIEDRHEELLKFYSEVFGKEQKSKTEIDIEARPEDWEKVRGLISTKQRIMVHWMNPKPEDRSGHDWRLACLCLEEGITDPGLLYQIILHNPHGKAESYPSTDRYISDLISKAITEAGHSEFNNESNAAQPRTQSYVNLNLPSSLDISRLEIMVEWVAQNLIPKQSITLFHSIGGVGKTYLMYALGKAVAEGEPFFGLDVLKENVYYVDFENPVPEIADRLKKIGGSENFKIWHLGHEPAPIRFDADEWEIYKTFPPGLFIIDSLRSSHLLEENSSKDAAFVMARHKEIRALGNTIILIHHENKIGGYRGSTAWFDLSDHILKFSRVKRIGSDEDAEEDNFDLPIRLGLGGKSRFSSAMDLKPMYFKFENHQLCCVDDPEEETLNKMAGLLNPLTPPNQSEFQKLVKQNLWVGQKDFRRLLKKGEDRNFWFVKRSTMKNKFEYFKA